MLFGRIFIFGGLRLLASGRLRLRAWRATRRTRLISLRGTWRHFVLLSWLIAWLRTVLLGGAAILFFERFQNAFDPFAIVAAVGWRGARIFTRSFAAAAALLPRLALALRLAASRLAASALRIARLSIAGTIAGLRLSVLRASILAALLSRARLAILLVATGLHSAIRLTVLLSRHRLRRVIGRRIPLGGII